MATINPLAQLLKGGATPAPGLAASVQDLQTRQMMAQALLQQSQQQVPAQMIGGHYVRPNAGQVIANALSGISGYAMMNDANKEAADLLRQQQAQEAAMFGIQMPGSHQTQVESQGQQGPATAYPIGGQQAPGMVNQSAMPLLPGMSPQQSYMIAQRMGMPAYLKLALEQQAPTDIQRNLMAAGYQPGTPEFQRALGVSINKPIQVEGMLVDPVTGMPTFSAPRDGMQYRYDQSGNAYSIPVTGYGEIQANNAARLAEAQKSAESKFDLVEVQVPGGGTQMMPRDQALNLTRVGGAGYTPSKLEQGADRAIDLIQEARKILPNASSGLISTAITRGQEVFGQSTEQSQADARLQALAGQLTGMMPRFEGPQSDADRLLYQQMAGDIANPMKPIETRLAALDTIETLQKKYSPTARQDPSLRNQAPPRVNGADASGVQTNNGIQQIESAQQYYSLPSGTLFRAPDGSVRRKP